jgi:hypothetical protein
MNLSELSYPLHRDAAVMLMGGIQKLVDALALEDAAYSLSINFHGPSRRIDIARLTPDGMHIQEWLAAISVDPANLETFGTPVGVPVPPGGAN